MPCFNLDNLENQINHDIKRDYKGIPNAFLNSNQRLRRDLSRTKCYSLIHSRIKYKRTDKMLWIPSVIRSGHQSVKVSNYFKTQPGPNIHVLPALLYTQ